MAVDELDRIRESARDVVHTTDRRTWVYRCAVCRAAVEIIREELGVGEEVALNLFAAWTVENGGGVYAEAVREWQRTMGGVAPDIKKVADAVEREAKGDEPWL